MARLHVCSLSRLERTLDETGAERVMSLVGDATPTPRLARLAPERRLLVGVSDIVRPQDGHVLAHEDHIRQIVDFARGWEREWPHAAPMVVHCYAGVSRSAAGAFIVACALRPDVKERRFAQLIRERSPTATPNARFVALADALLGRRGRMIEAIAAIGRGADCFEGVPFHLDLDGEAP